MEDAPNVAIVMRSKNEQPYTEPALDALFRQSWKPFTLYNVDSGSTDGTLEVIRRRNPLRLTEIAPGDYVPGKVLNDMIARTVEPIVVLLNADAIPLSNEWLERLLAPILAGAADATMSRQEARPSARFIVRYDYARAYDPRSIKGENADFFSAVACAFKRELWQERPFSASGYAEDLDWAKRCRAGGARFMLVPESRVEHSHNYTIRELYRKKYRHGLVHVRIFGQRPAPARGCAACARELVRDLIHALACLRIDTIPYNVAYRATIHWAIYRGLRDGTRAEAGAHPGR